MQSRTQPSTAHRACSLYRATRATVGRSGNTAAGALLIGFTTASVVGCGDGPAVSSTVTVWDSAGVQIVETQPDGWPPPEVWFVGEDATVEIGIREGNPDYELFQVRGAVGLEDGGTVIAEFGSRLRYYDPSGVHVETLERDGEGPGEARAFMAMGSYRGDSLLVTTGLMGGQRNLSQLMMLAEDGTYGRNVMAYFPGSGERNATTTWISGGGSAPTPLEDGSLVVVGAARIELEGSGRGLLPGRAGVMRLDPEGGFVDTMATLTTGTYERRPLEPRGFDLMLDEADAPRVRSRGMLLYLTTGERFIVDVYEAQPLGVDVAPVASSRLVRSFRVHAPRDPSTAESREAYMNPVIEIFAGDQTGIERNDYRDRLESLRSPDSIPAVQDLRLDALGNIWLETYQPPGASARETARERGINVETGPSPWIVLDPEGRLLGTVLIPIGLRVLEIGDDYVLGLWIDSLGVEHVRRHPLVKS